MLARKPTAMSLMAIASIVVGIGSGPCFGINEVRSGLRSSNIMVEKLTMDESPLLRRGSSASTTVEIRVNYDISNDCGLDANAINNVTVGVKEGLIAATKNVTINILASAYGGTGTQPAGGNSGRYNPHSKSNVKDSTTTTAYYSDQHPVIITSITDKNFNCGDAPQKCQRVHSTVSVVVTHGSTNEVRRVFQTKFRTSLENGDFFGAMPEGTMPTCSEAISTDDTTHLVEKGVA